MTIEQLDYALQVCDIPYFAERRFAFRCDAMQASLLRREKRQVLLNCARQSGKSTVTALKAVHTAFFKPRSTVVVTAKDKKQTAEFLRKVRGFAAVGEMLHRTRGSRFQVHFANGSRVVGATADRETIRGFSSIELLIVDEASWVKDEVFEAAEPMLAVSNGSLWVLSTPDGRRGYFYRAWMEPGDEWAKLRVRAVDCARIPKDFIERQRKKLSARKFAQDFECQFLDASDGLFDGESVGKAFRTGIPRLAEFELDDEEEDDDEHNTAEKSE